jgi:Txe/YoeB family toxin of Txe-Axe toxin-antitoxin module
MTAREVGEFRSFVAIAEKNPFDVKLKTHKLKGVDSIYSARLNYSDRVLFFIQLKYTIVVIDIGSHDDVY